MRQDTDKPRPGEGVEFQHIRRVTGWLSDSPGRWNNAKRAELAERVTHPLNGIYPPGACGGPSPGPDEGSVPTYTERTLL